MKYRVLQDGRIFYPQKRFLWFWLDFCTILGHVFFLTKEEAEDFIKNQTKNVVWTDEDKEEE